MHKIETLRTYFNTREQEKQRINAVLWLNEHGRYDSLRGEVEVQNMNPTCWDPIDVCELINPSNR